MGKSTAKQPPQMCVAPPTMAPAAKMSTSTPANAVNTIPKAIDTGASAAGMPGLPGWLGTAAGMVNAPNTYNTMVNGKKPNGEDASTLDRIQAGTNLTSLAANTTNLAANGVSKLGTNAVAAGMNGVKTPIAQAAAKAAINGGSGLSIKQAARAAGAKGSQVNQIKHAARAATKGSKTAATIGRGAGNLAKGAGAVANGVGDAAALMGKSAARNGGRFVPGLNVAIAGMDTVSAGMDFADWRNGKASGGKAITSGVRALGSMAAATNIPIVSQVGAGVSVLADLAQRFWWSD